MTSKAKPTFFERRKLKAILDFQFGKGASDVLVEDNLFVEYSKVTKRIRYVFNNNQRLFSYRVTDGLLIPSIHGGELLYRNNFGKKVIANSEAEPFIRKSRSLFAKHVVDADTNISIRDEVIIINENNEFLGVGTAKLPSRFMLEMKKGVAVDTRKGKEK